MRIEVVGAVSVFEFVEFFFSLFFRSVAFDHYVCSVVFYAVFIHFFAADCAGVIEAKSPTNLTEMFSENNKNCKALQECVYYFMQENLRFGNNEVKHIIITNYCDFYIPGRYAKIGSEIEKRILEKLFATGKNIASFADSEGAAFYYRTSGGRYFNVISDVPTGSTQDKPY